jgi:hypothetical protein
VPRVSSKSTRHSGSFDDDPLLDPGPASAALVAIYFRAPVSEIERFVRRPDLLKKLDLRVALSDGRALDLGRRWDELGCLLEGGVTAPQSGPTVGDGPLASNEDRVAWAWVEPERVRAFAEQLAAIRRDDFVRLYRVDDEETADAAPGERTERIVDHATYLFRRLEQLRDHYAAAARAGEAMLVRIGERAF